MHSCAPASPALPAPVSASSPPVEGVDYLDSSEGRRVYLSKQEAAKLGELSSRRKAAVWQGFLVVVLGGLVLGGVAWVVTLWFGGLFTLARMLAFLFFTVLLGVGVGLLAAEATNRHQVRYEAERERLGVLHAAEAVQVPRERWS